MKALIILADGFEEIEAFTTVDVLRRAWVDVTVSGLVSTVVEGAHKVRTMTDSKITDVSPDSFDALILPGGPGYKNLLNSTTVLKMVQDFNKKNKIIAAICAAPAVLAKAGALDGKIATIYPGMESHLPRPRDAKVVVDKNIITSRSPGTAMDFALKLAEILTTKAGAKKVLTAMAM